jgi:hypothetical protein
VTSPQPRVVGSVGGEEGSQAHGGGEVWWGRSRAGKDSGGEEEICT